MFSEKNCNDKDFLNYIGKDNDTIIDENSTPYICCAHVIKLANENPDLFIKVINKYMIANPLMKKIKFHNGNILTFFYEQKVHEKLLEKITIENGLSLKSLSGNVHLNILKKLEKNNNNNAILSFIKTPGFDSIHVDLKIKDLIRILDVVYNSSPYDEKISFFNAIVPIIYQEVIFAVPSDDSWLNLIFNIIKNDDYFLISESLLKLREEFQESYPYVFLKQMINKNNIQAQEIIPIFLKNYFPAVDIDSIHMFWNAIETKDFDLFNKKQKEMNTIQKESIKYLVEYRNDMIDEWIGKNHENKNLFEYYKKYSDIKKEQDLLNYNIKKEKRKENINNTEKTIKKKRI